MENLEVQEQEEGLELKAQPEGKPDKPNDRPEKNWQAEINRKVTEAVSDRDRVINDLKTQIEGIQKNQSVKQLEDEKKKLEDQFSDLGYDKEVFSIIEKQMESRISKAKAEIKAESSKEIGSLKQQLYASSKDKHLEDIRNQDKSGLIKDNYDEIKSVINELAPELWADRQSIQNAVSMVLGSIVLRNPVKKTVVKSSSPTEDGPTPEPSKDTSSAKKSTIDKMRQKFGEDSDDAVAGAAKASDELDKMMYGK